MTKTCITCKSALDELEQCPEHGILEEDEKVEKKRKKVVKKPVKKVSKKK